LKIQTRAGGLKDVAADALLVPVFEGESPTDKILAELDAATGGLVAGLAESGELRAKRDAVVYLHRPGGLGAGRLVLVGMGAREGDVVAQLERAVSVGVRSLRGRRHASLAVADRPELDPERFGEAVVRAVAVAAVDLWICKTEERDELRVESLTVATAPDREEGVQRGVARGEIVAAGMNFARDLGNAPANDLTPRVFAERVSEMAAAEGLACEVLDETRMKEMGMGALIGVAKGSEEPPRLIVLTYEPAGGGEDDDVLTFVGKGLTFDSGGISIKPREGMEWMSTTCAAAPRWPARCCRSRGSSRTAA
jgi:leucyl aminopeptidase